MSIYMVQCCSNLVLWCCLSFAGSAESCTLERAADPICSRCVRTISMYSNHVCVVLYDASVACAGYRIYGQLGDGKANVNDATKALGAASAFAGIPASSVAVGPDFTCILEAASEVNQVYCLGYQNVLGGGQFPDMFSKKPVAIQGLKPTPRIVQLVGGISTVCASYAGTDDFDTVQCWGAGYGDTPTGIAGTSGTVSLAGCTDTYYFGRMSHYCVARSDGTVAC